MAPCNSYVERSGRFRQMSQGKRKSSVRRFPENIIYVSRVDHYAVSPGEQQPEQQYNRTVSPHDDAYVNEDTSVNNVVEVESDFKWKDEQKYFRPLLALYSLQRDIAQIRMKFFMPLLEWRINTTLESDT